MQVRSLLEPTDETHANQGEQKLTSRREFMKSLGALAVLTHASGAGLGESFIAAPFQSLPSDCPGDDPWCQLPSILARIRPPQFPDKTFDITRFGARGDNKTDSSEALRKAISACNAAGGGRVVVPAGEFLTGAIHLKNNVNLHLLQGSTVRFIRDTSKYPLVFTRWEGVELMNFSPCIYAFEQENIAITGSGTIDGNAGCDYWWPWKGRVHCGWNQGQPSQDKDRKLLFEMAEKGVAVKDRLFGEGHFLRPQFIQPYRCKNVLISGVTLKNSPMWQVHPVLCTNVTVQDLTISGASMNRDSAPNTDGCDPESCTDVLIRNCTFDTGDDCIAIKAGRNADGRRVNVPCQNIVIQDCHMRDGHGGITLGSEISGGVRNVFAENCRMDSPRLDIAVRIKNNAMRGGTLENIFVRNIEVGQVAVAGVSIDFYYEEGEAGKFIPVVRNVDIRNLTTRKAQYALYLRGFKTAPIEGVHLADCDLRGVEKNTVIENVKGLSFKNVRINGNLAGRQEGPMATTK